MPHRTASPPVAPARSPVPAVLRHSATLAWRGIVKTVHYTEALLDVTLHPVIFLLLFVYVFGGAIADPTGTCPQHALPGVLVQTVVFASAGTGTGLADDLKTGIFDRFRSLSISPRLRCWARSGPTSSTTSRPARSCSPSASCSGSGRAAVSSVCWVRSGS